MRKVSPPGERRSAPIASAADFLRCRDVAVQQRRREISHRHIVKAMTGLILRKEFRGIDLQREQIPNGVLVFGAGETTECVGSAWIGMRGGRFVERVRKPRHNSAVSAFLRALHSRRRHLSCAKFSDNFFPDLRMLRDVVQPDAVEIQVPLLHWCCCGSRHNTGRPWSARARLLATREPTLCCAAVAVPATSRTCIQQRLHIIRKSIGDRCKIAITPGRVARTALLSLWQILPCSLGLGQTPLVHVAPW